VYQLQNGQFHHESGYFNTQNSLAPQENIWETTEDEPWATEMKEEKKEGSRLGKEGSYQLILV
jgi:hypothetical protein